MPQLRREFHAASDPACKSPARTPAFDQARKPELIDGMQVWSVYLLRCGDGSYYTGIATDVERRLVEHGGGNRGAKYLRGRGPLELVYQRPVGDRSTASRIEYRIKQLSREQKKDLGQLPALIDAILDSIKVSA